MARTLIVVGLVLIAAGLLVSALGRVGLPLGRLPGDLTYKGRNFSLFAPLGTSLVLSALLSLLLYLFTRLRK